MEYNIGSKIKAARLKKKMTQEQVAELLGVYAFDRRVGQSNKTV